jgi:hypothetical protein
MADRVVLCGGICQKICGKYVVDLLELCNNFVVNYAGLRLFASVTDNVTW